MDFTHGYEDFATRYYWTRLLSPLKCCGCFSNRFGSGVACLTWAGFSFYFAILAFMQKSPFYSHLHEVPLIIFGVVNLIFGCISIAGFVVVYFRPIYVRVQIMVYVIAAGASLVLISMLVNYILFVVNRGAFETWCIDHSRSVAQDDIRSQTGGNTTITIGSEMDYYNCDRLFANQVKWSLLCVVAMYIIYVHWMLVFAVFAGTSFFLIPPRAAPIPPPVVPPLSEIGEPMPPPPPTTIMPPTGFSNLPPSSSEKKQNTTYYTLKPAKKSITATLKKKRVDPNLLSVLGLKVNESGHVIHIADDDSLPRYSTDHYNYSSSRNKRWPSSSSKTFVPSSNEEDLR
ncbi:hypothetical protein BDB00DRAFT_804121 [Zychaea mexicana]|uniref:uncharacterized protein n=1 Tax=Zychaea mexicana TaxID=64656 RepID=UPI0022FE14EA|nr:uncharacterized protein BDB00DRAFT_804121 [Zychaea mexicana]KAI9497355.1 hypothetical protein BDB00DRAFT_804121 [Zychaea mexicana]